MVLPQGEALEYSESFESSENSNCSELFLKVIQRYPAPIPSSTNPSTLFIVADVPLKKSFAISAIAKVAINPAGISLLIETLLTSIGKIIELTPKMSKIFIVLLPMIFPIASPGLPLMHENTLIIISGSDVPNATIVNPMMSGDSFAFTPMEVAPFTSQLAPRISAAKPIIKRNNGNNEAMMLEDSSYLADRVKFG